MFVHITTTNQKSQSILYLILFLILLNNSSYPQSVPSETSTNFKHSNLLGSAVITTTSDITNTVIPGGEVGGTWGKAGSPYLINGEITIPYWETLNIEPGVLVQFQGHYKLNVQGRLLAVGTETDSIVFTVSDTTGFSKTSESAGGWHGIRFNDNYTDYDSSKIIYCRLEYGKAMGPNWEDQQGGAIFLDNFSELIISDCLFKNNSVGSNGIQYAAGGAISANSCNLQVDNCTFIMNKALDIMASGGAIYCGSNSTNVWLPYQVKISNCRFIENSASSRAGVFIQNWGEDDLIIDAVITNCEFINNNADHYTSLGISNSMFKASNCVFTDNKAILYTAGACFNKGSVGTVSSCLFTSNTAATGGGNYNAGGASVWTDAHVNFMNCTFADNSAAYGAGLNVGNGGIATVTNSIFWGNSPEQISLETSGEDVGTLTINYCDIQGGNELINVTDPSSTLIWGEGNVDAEPLFVYSDNEDYHITENSPCNGAGINLIMVEGEELFAPDEDIEGNIRPNPPGTMPDMGAYESQYPAGNDDIDISAGLIVYYPFNDSAEDSIGNSDGTLIGDITPVADRYNRPDHAYAFDGDEDYITLPESEEFTSIDRELTVSAWINPESLSFETGIIHRDRFWRFFLDGNGTVFGNIFDENGFENRTGSSSQVPLNQWSHVAFTFDGQNIIVYVNGEQSGELSYPVVRIGQEYDNSAPVIGKGFGLSQNYFNGSIDDIRIYDRALSEAEMAELYRDKEPPATPLLTNPEDGAVNDLSLFQVLNWSPIWNASTYHLQLSTQQDFFSITYEDSTLTSSVEVVGPLSSNQKYYWRVRAKNLNGTSSWSEIRFFTISGGIGTVYFNDIHPDKITLGNNYYELKLQKSTGAITGIVDKTAGQIISETAQEGHLWGATFYSDHWESIYVDSPDDTVSYEWDAANKTLTFTYKPNYENRDVPAQVFFKITEDYYFDLQIKLNNNSGGYLQSVDLPYGLEMNADQIEEAVLPVMPGAKLNKKYFEERHSGNAGWYPSALVFADYIYFKVNSGQYGMYTVLEEDITPNVERDIRAPEEGYNNFKWMHAYRIGLRNGEPWASPLVRIRIGQDKLQTAAGFRNDTGLNDVASLEEKLGDNYTQVSQALWTQLDFGSFYGDFGLTLTDREGYNRIWNQLPSPSLLFVLGWQTGLEGSDATTPDIFPVDERLGTNEDLRITLDNARQAGHLVMPYINPTIWNINSQTANSYPKEDFARFDIYGNLVYENYGVDRVHYSVSPYLPTVVSRIELLFNELQTYIPVDLVFEDQIGPRGGLDFNPSSPSPAHYPQGWLEHTRRYRDRLLTTEFGYDRIIETHIGFLGNLIAWDRTIFPNSGWGGFADQDWGSNTWEYYPIVVMMAGDKVAFYSMGADTPTTSKPVLTWNMAMKQMPAFHGISLDSLDHTWHNTAMSFQKHVISRYFNERMLDYIKVGEDVTKSRFATHEVLTNWSKINTLTVNNHTLATEGFLVTSYDQTLTAGIFTNYNGLNLNSGDQYIIETRYADSIVVRHPQGNDTPIRLDHRSLSSSSNLCCYAFIENTATKIPVEIDSQFVSFNMQRYYNDLEVSRYVITPEPVYLSAPGLTQPDNWESIQIEETTLKWEPINRALNYQVQIATEDTFNLSIVDSAIVTDTEFNSNKLERGKTYFWRVRATNETLAGNWSFIYRFRINGINISDRLVTHYPLDGNPEDVRGNSDGTIMGDVIPAPDRFERTNQAYFFDGDEDYILFPTTKAYTSIDKQITVSAWINPDNIISETSIMMRDLFWRLIIYGDGMVFGNVFNESQYESRIYTSQNVPMGAWSLVGFTYDCQKIVVYLNGEHSGELYYPAKTIGFTTANSPTVMGKRFGNSEHDFGGRIDEVRVYDRALTQDEMAELFRITGTENFAPQITFFSPAIDTTVTEGDSLLFSIIVQDEDNDTLYTNWFYDELSIAADTTTNDTLTTLIHFQPGSVGSHSVRISASDGKLKAETTWNINVEEFVPVVSEENNIPTEYSLAQNYPNPSNPTTTINYDIPEDSFVKLVVYNILGEQVAVLVNEQKKAGRYIVKFSTESGSVSGVYIYRIQAGKFSESKKMILLR